ncbi:hypothetical protein J1N35_035015 [Gossypium stocksii]|uniref:Uncharacterized protein n=1 Tax=Gossypium stocksii TaxID=47602 RepID=A0A9D3ZR95_9ROSI|nr:hypothetical protein J1N35_035015 [Gossypium stocksii]
MSGLINTIVYYDSEVRDSENMIIFLSKKITWLAVNSNILLSKLRGRIRQKIIRSNQMRVSSLKYQFSALFDPVRYDACEIRYARGLKEMVLTHIASGSLILKLYANFVSANEIPRRWTYVPVREARMEEQPESPTT